MAKSEVGSTHVQKNGTSGAFTLTWPAGVQAGDFAVIMLSWYYQNANYGIVTGPSGFASRKNTDLAGGTLNNGDSAIAIWTKDITTSESGTVSITLGGSASTIYGNALLVVMRGDGALTYVSLGAHGTGTATDAIAPEVSGTSGQLLMGLFALSDPPGTVNSGPSGMTLAEAGSESTNNGRIYWQGLTGSGLTGDKTYDYTNSREYAALLMLVNDAGGAAAASAPPDISRQLRLAQLLLH